jgi:hypothetical protein
MIDNPPKHRPNIPKLIKKLDMLVISVSEDDTTEIRLYVPSQGRLRNRENDLFSSPIVRKRHNQRPSPIRTEIIIDSSFDCSHEPMALESRSLNDNNCIIDDDICAITEGLHVLCSPLKTRPRNTLSMASDNGKSYYIHVYFHLYINFCKCMHDTYSKYDT